MFTRPYLHETMHPLSQVLKCSHANVAAIINLQSTNLPTELWRCAYKLTLFSLCIDAESNPQTTVVLQSFNIHSSTDPGWGNCQDLGRALWVTRGAKTTHLGPQPGIGEVWSVEHKIASLLVSKEIVVCFNQLWPWRILVQFAVEGEAVERWVSYVSESLCKDTISLYTVWTFDVVPWCNG